MTALSRDSAARFARVWRGRVSPDKADAYERYWLGVGAAPLIERGALAVEMLREDRDSYVQFVTISYWASIEAMAPGGEDPHRAHHLPRDPDYLIELPDRVEILTVLERR